MTMSAIVYLILVVVTLSVSTHLEVSNVFVRMATNWELLAETAPVIYKQLGIKNYIKL